MSAVPPSKTVSVATSKNSKTIGDFDKQALLIALEKNRIIFQGKEQQAIWQMNGKMVDEKNKADIVTAIKNGNLRQVGIFSCIQTSSGKYSSVSSSIFIASADLDHTNNAANPLVTTDLVHSNNAANAQATTVASFSIGPIALDELLYDDDVLDLDAPDIFDVISKSANGVRAKDMLRGNIKLTIQVLTPDQTPLLRLLSAASPVAVAVSTAQASLNAAAISATPPANPPILNALALANAKAEKDAKSAHENANTPSAASAVSAASAAGAKSANDGKTPDKPAANAAVKPPVASTATAVPSKSNAASRIKWKG